MKEETIFLPPSTRIEEQEAEDLVEAAHYVRESLNPLASASQILAELTLPKELRNALDDAVGSMRELDELLSFHAVHRATKAAETKAVRKIGPPSPFIQLPAKHKRNDEAAEKTVRQPA
ncbi:hypothetical protein KKA13_01430 [Patescibacteria group bacterium]|nr:hypothetical protein [Patescibacteria group bacterium]MBU1613394.1 hypothetical protein [Patescibacteria group bacterium]